MILAFLTAWTVGHAAAAGVSWKVEFSTAAVAVQETQIVYRPSAAGPEWHAEMLASATTSFSVVSVEAAKDGSAWTWTVLPLDAGRLAFVARWRSPEGEVTAPPVFIDVKPPNLPKDVDIADIKGPMSARRALWPWLAAALLGAAAWEAWRRWKSRPAGAVASDPAQPPVAPEVKAAEALADLAASGLWERGEFAAYYLRLTDILRSYLEDRFGESATAMTSSEVARLIKSKGLDLNLTSALRDVLMRADLVKFARITPQGTEGPLDAARVSELVRATTPAAVPTPGTEAAK
jgi:hypothetical protein